MKVNDIVAASPEPVIQVQPLPPSPRPLLDAYSVWAQMCDEFVNEHCNRHARRTYAVLKRKNNHRNALSVVTGTL